MLLSTARLFVSPADHTQLYQQPICQRKKLSPRDVKSFAQVTLHVREELGFELK